MPFLPGGLWQQVIDDIDTANLEQFQCLVKIRELARLHISEDEVEGFSPLTYRRDVFDPVHCQKMHSRIRPKQSPGDCTGMLIAIYRDQLGLSVHAIEYPGSAQSAPGAQFEEGACRFGGG